MKSKLITRVFHCIQPAWLKSLMLASMILLFTSGSALSQTESIIGAGSNAANTSSGAASDGGPIYQTGGTSTFFYSMYHYVYTAAELQAAGVTPGVFINRLSWRKANTSAISSPTLPILFDIHLNNSTASVVPVAPQDYSSLVTGATLVYSATNQALPADTGWVDFVFLAPFLYTGGSLEITTKWDMSAAGIGVSTGNLAWYKDVANTLAYAGSTSSTSLSLNRTVRAQLKITHFPATACIDPPNAGTTQSTASSICPLQNFTLSLSGYSLGTGQTYQWQSSLDSASWADVSGATNPILTLTQSLPILYYRCMVSCGNSSVPSTPVRVDLNTNALVGIVTVNPANPISATNFHSLSALIGELNCAGISGPLTIEVAASSGPYVEQLTIGDIVGASTTNTITMNGNGNTIEFLATNTNSRHTLRLDGAKYWTFNNLTFKSLGTTASELGWAVHLTNSADHNTFTNCTFESATNLTSTGYAAFVASNSNTSATDPGTPASNLIITNSHFIGGYYGLSISGPSSAPYAESCIIENNVFEDFYLSGIYVRGTNNSSYSGNDISRATRTTLTSFWAIALFGDLSGTVIDANRIHDNANGGTTTSLAYGIYGSSATGSITSPFVVSNNAIYNINSSGTTYGIYFVGNSDYYRIYHNTVILDHTGHTGSSIIANFYTTSLYTNVELRNNIFYINNGSTGTHYHIWSSNATSTPISNNNVFWNQSATGTKVTARLGTTNYVTLANWQSHSNSFDMNSVNANPAFVNSGAGDVAPQAAAINDLGAPVGILSDLLGNPRSTTSPDAGAVEFVPTAAVCFTPSGLSGIPSGASALALTWIAGGSETSWEVEYGSLGIAQGTGSVVAVSGNPTTVISGLTFGQSYSVYVRAICDSSAGLNSAWVGPVNIALNYCTSGATNAFDSKIRMVVVGNDSVVSPVGAGNCGSYTDYTNLPPFQLQYGNPAPMAVQYGSCGSNFSSFATIYVDFNNDLVFDQATELVASGSVTAATSLVTVANIPSNVQHLGNVLMRVVLREGGSATLNLPCGTFTYGETQDFMVNMDTIQAAGCLVTTIPAVTNGVICSANPAVLAGSPGSATSSIIWKDNTGFVRGSGNQFVAPLTNANATYTAQDAELAGAAVQVGPPTSIQTGGFGNFSNGMYFTAITHFRLDSVTIRSDGPASGTIQIWSANPNQDTAAIMLQSAPYAVSTSGDNAIPVGMYVAPGNYYLRGTFTSGNLWRSTGGAVYPYVSPGVMSIDSAWLGVNSPGNLNRVYYFFEWVVSEVCVGAGVNAVVTLANPITASAPFVERFESSPFNVVLNLGAVSSNVGVAQTAGFRRNVYSTFFGQFTTAKTSSITSTTLFGFDYKLTDWANWNWPGVATALGAGDTIKIEVTTNCGQTYTLLDYISQTEHVNTNEYATYSTSLAAFAGMDVEIRVTFRQSSGIDCYFDVDNVFIGQIQSGISLITSALDPADGQCSPVSRAVSATMNSNSPILQVMAIPKVNGIMQPGVTMSLVNGMNLAGSWTGTVPAFNSGDVVEVYLMAMDSMGDSLMVSLGSYSDLVLVVDAGQDIFINSGDTVILTASTNVGVSGYLEASRLGGNGSNGVSFNVQALSAVNIDTLYLQLYGTVGNLAAVNVWVNQQAVNGPPNITAANGWMKVIDSTFAVIQNSNFAGNQALTALAIPGGLQLSSGSEIGIFVQAYGASVTYTTYSPGLDVFTDGVLTISTGTNVGYGGAAPNPAFHPRMFNGALSYSGAQIIWTEAGTTAPITATIGTDTLTNTGQTYPAPYGNWYFGARHQMLIPAAELLIAGIGPGVINSLAFDVAQTQGVPLTDFTIKMGHTLDNVMTVWQTGLSSVYYSPSYVDTFGWNVHHFQTPFLWNGTDNVVIEVCFNNNAFTANARVRQSGTAYQSTMWFRADDSVGVCGNTSITGNAFQRPNMQIGANSGAIVGNGASIVVAPNVTTSYKATAFYKGCLAEDTITVNVTLPNNQLSGVVRYDNANGTPMSNSTAILMDGLTGQIAATSNTDASGAFAFTGIRNGNYLLSATTNKAWGGVNATDALAISNFFIGSLPLNSLQLLSADVNSSNTVNSTDALLVARRFVGLSNSFPSGNWVFESSSLTMAGLGLQNQDVLGLCYGDVNASYSPNGNRIAPKLAIEWQGFEQVGNEAKAIPVSIDRNLNMGALSVVLLLPEGLKLEHVRAVKLSTGFFEFRQLGNELRIGWYSTTSLNLQTGDVLFELELSADSGFEGNMAIGELSEAANGLAEAYPMTGLRMPVLSTKHVGLFSSRIFPNPAHDLTWLEYSLPESGNVTIRVTDALGKLVYQQIEKPFEAGVHQLPLELEKLSAGTYHVTLLYNNYKEITQQLLKLQVVR